MISGQRWVVVSPVLRIRTGETQSFRLAITWVVDGDGGETTVSRRPSGKSGVVTRVVVFRSHLRGRETRAL